MVNLTPKLPPTQFSLLSRLTAALLGAALLLGAAPEDTSDKVLRLEDLEITTPRKSALTQALTDSNLDAR